MKLLIICGQHVNSEITKIKKYLENKNIEVLLCSNCGKYPIEHKVLEMGIKAQRRVKEKMDLLRDIDAALVLNHAKDRNGTTNKNYIGGATFLAMSDVYKAGKKIFLLNRIPTGMLHDQIKRFDPVIINGNLDLIQ